jgi:carboxyl-terminal processing protease
VRLKIDRSGREVPLEVTRGPLKIATVKGFRRGADNRWDFLLEPKLKIGYVQIAQFGSATPQDMQAAVESLKKQGVRAMIVDLRFCPGGSLESAVGVSKLFLTGGTIVSLHGRDDKLTRITADVPGALTDAPLVVLVNGQTASAAEVVAGALQDNRRAVVLGTRTLGKGSVQTLIKLDEGSGAIKLTTSRYRVPSGRSIDRRESEPSCQSQMARRRTGRPAVGLCPQDAHCPSDRR